jgi:CRP-like cAMP-binding protein
MEYLPQSLIDHDRARACRPDAFPVKATSDVLGTLASLGQPCIFFSLVTLDSDRHALDRVFAVHSGEVELYAHVVDGGRQTLHVERAGDIIGLTSVLTGSRPTVNAAKKVTSTITSIDKEVFLGFLSRHSELGNAMGIATSSWLSESNEA